MKLIQKTLTGGILLLLAGILFFTINLLFNSNISIQENINNIPLTHNGKNISDLLTSENYKKVGINPDDYDSFGDFLIDFKTFTGVTIDPIEENFSIGVQKDNGNMLYIPFRYNKSINNFEDKQNKNLAILDIYGSYKNDLVYGGINSKSGNRIIFEDELQHPESSILSDIFDVDLFDTSINVYDIQNTLRLADNLGLNKTELLAYLEEFTGDYDNANKYRDDACLEYKVNCDKYVSLNVTGKIRDAEGNPIRGAKLELLNNLEISTKTNDDGGFSMLFSNYKFSHLRFKASVPGYSDGFRTVSLNDYFSEDRNKDMVLSFKLNQAGNTYSITSSTKDEYKKGIFYIIENELSKYFIPIDGIYYKSGGKYTNHNFTIYTYQFNKDSNMDNLLENDTFQPIYGYVGNIMKTFGMPYIQMIDIDSGEELYIKSDNPMILQNQVYHMKELYNNSDGIYEAITKSDMEFLVEQSNQYEGYPIDFEFLTTNGFLRWPARWVLDRDKGIWDNIGSKVLNIDGLVELPFYHVKVAE